MNDLLTQPVITSIEVLHARRCDEGISHLLASSIVFKQRGGTALRKAEIRSATTIKRSQIFSVSRTRGNGRLTAADMSDAGAGEERAITGGGPSVVEDSAVVGQKIAVDIPIAWLVGALVDDAGISPEVAR